MKLSKPLKWDDLANYYDKSHSNSERKAKTLPMNSIFDWASKQTDKFQINQDGSISKILRK